MVIPRRIYKSCRTRILKGYVFKYHIAVPRAAVVYSEAYDIIAVHNGILDS